MNNYKQIITAVTVKGGIKQGSSYIGQIFSQSNLSIYRLAFDF
jgi:hypothetical protein